MPASCSHLDQVEVLQLPDPLEGCQECLLTGDTWVHLRMCHSCGHVGCCDSSPNRHASAHFRATDHPVMRSAEPGEEWSFCFVDEVAFRLSRR